MILPSIEFWSQIFGEARHIDSNGAIFARKRGCWRVLQTSTRRRTQAHAAAAGFREERRFQPKSREQVQQRRRAKRWQVRLTLETSLRKIPPSCLSAQPNAGCHRSHCSWSDRWWNFQLVLEKYQLNQGRAGNSLCSFRSLCRLVLSPCIRLLVKMDWEIFDCESVNVGYKRNTTEQIVERFGLVWCDSCVWKKGFVPLFLC